MAVQCVNSNFTGIYSFGVQNAQKVVLKLQNFTQSKTVDWLG